MNKNSLTDYLGYTLFKTLGPFVRMLPLGFAFFLGRRTGDLFYFFDLKHRALAYANIKAALGAELSCRQIKNTTRRFYQSYGQNFIEILLMPLIDKKYINTHIEAEGIEHAETAFRRGHGLIFLSMHTGSWELSNLISEYMGFPFLLFVQNQRYPRLNSLLNSYRLQRGCKIVEGEGGVRQLIKALKSNSAIGMTADQGGRDGALVKFFGRSASMPSGAIRFAIKYGAAIVPVYYTRKYGSKVKIIFDPVFEIKRSQDTEKDVASNLQELMHVYEKNIRKYPQEYLWTYKIWKYGNEKRILILSDGKAGHLRQAQAAALAAVDYFKLKKMDVKVDTIEVKFKNNLYKAALILSSLLSGRYNCQGCLWCFRRFLENDTYKSLTAIKPDLVISCGSALAPVNYILSRENLAKSVVVLRPALLNTSRFNLVIMPRHDNPPKRRNVLTINGALNSIDGQYLKEQSERLSGYGAQGMGHGDFIIGLLIGGDTKNFHLDSAIVSEVLGQLKAAAEKYNAGILITTSRRTSVKIEKLVKEQMGNYPRCKALIIANEKNIPEAVGGILGLSKLVIVSAESISMISEAASAGCQVLVFNSRLDGKHTDFLDSMQKAGYIYLCDARQIGPSVDLLLSEKVPLRVLNNRNCLMKAFDAVLN